MPESTSVPAPLIVRAPTPEVAPLTIKIVPVAGTKSPLPAKVLAPDEVRLAVVMSFAPLLKFSTEPAAPNWAAALIVIEPSNRLTPPAKVFAPVSTKAPAPPFCNLPTPAMMPP